MKRRWVADMVDLKITDMRTYTSDINRPMTSMEMWVDIPYRCDLSRPMSAWVEIDKSDKENPVRAIELYIGKEGGGKPPYSTVDYANGQGFSNLEDDEPDYDDRRALVFRDINNPEGRVTLSSIEAEIKQFAADNYEKKYVMSSDEWHTVLWATEVGATEYPRCCGSTYCEDYADYMEAMAYLPDEDVIFRDRAVEYLAELQKFGISFVHDEEIEKQEESGQDFES